METNRKGDPKRIRQFGLQPKGKAAIGGRTWDVFFPRGFLGTAAMVIFPGKNGGWKGDGEEPRRSPGRGRRAAGVREGMSSGSQRERFFRQPIGYFADPAFTVKTEGWTEWLD
ncbi:MAG: hypothetical protein ACLFRG_02725 [Desulfococcaceae bacterium]